MMTLGVSAIAIGLSIYLGGGEMTAHITEVLSAPLTGSAPSLAPMFSPAAENELGFYSALWIAYGLVLVMTARNLALHLSRVPILAGVFFAGGVGRGLAWLRVGPPPPAFVLLTVIELVLPVIFVALWATARSSAKTKG